MATSEQVHADLAKLNAVFEAAGAVLTDEDGERWIDPTLAPPDALRAYRGLLSYGYATGVL